MLCRRPAQKLCTLWEKSLQNLKSENVGSEKKQQKKNLYENQIQIRQNFCFP